MGTMTILVAWLPPFFATTKKTSADTCNTRAAAPRFQGFGPITLNICLGNTIGPKGGARSQASRWLLHLWHRWVNLKYLKPIWKPSCSSASCLKSLDVKEVAIGAFWSNATRSKGPAFRYKPVNSPNEFGYNPNLLYGFHAEWPSFHRKSEGFHGAHVSSVQEPSLIPCSYKHMVNLYTYMYM